MKILIVSNMYPSDEMPYAGTYVKNQYEYLKNELKQDIDLLYMLRKHTSTIGSIIKYIKFIYGALVSMDLNYKIIHVHFLSMHYLVAYLYKIFNKNIRVVLTIHGSDINLLETSSLQYRFYRYLISKTRPLVISVGKELGQEFFNKFHIEPAYYLMAGVDDTLFYESNEAGNKRYDILYIGSFTYKKGVDLLINAIEEMNDENINYCFVGQGPYKERLIKLNKIFNNITIFDSLEQGKVREMYLQSKYIIVPSRHEAFGLVVSEAMYCGTPAIVSSAGGLKEQVVHGENGYILKKNTPENISKAIKYAVDIEASDYKKMRSIALASNKQYSLQHVCDKIVIIYERMEEGDAS